MSCNKKNDLFSTEKNLNSWDAHGFKIRKKCKMFNQKQSLDKNMPITIKMPLLTQNQLKMLFLCAEQAKITCYKILSR